MSVSVTQAIRPPAATAPQGIDRLRRLSLRGLARMYLPAKRRFVHCVRRRGSGTPLPEGVSRRYTAITAIGLAGEEPADVALVLDGLGLDALCDSLIEEALRVDNLGDVALTYWAACRIGRPRAGDARRRLQQLLELQATPETVELAWAVTALCHEDAGIDGGALREQTARRLLESFNPRSGLFPHRIGATSGLRGHVCCFADIVYPVQALSHLFRLTGRQEALDAASACAGRACAELGAAGQWWWHYDYRTGRVVERYPVYSVHQDSMAPMALLDLRDAHGPDHRASIQRGLDWLDSVPELGGDALIDETNDVIWRKVARREPSKLARKLQAVTSRVHPSLRFPGVDAVLRPGAVDWECRPYHLGWILHAWTPQRARAWSHGAGGR